MEEKGIDASGQPAAVSERFRLLQIDVEEEEPETLENPTKSLVIHNIVWRRTQLGHDNMYCMTWISMYNMILFRYRAPGL